jgi:CheY-like chemotaxis protein
MTTHKLRILYCEDDADSREMMRIILTSEGFDVVCSISPNDCLRLIRNQHFDAFLLDNVMPGMSGADLCEQIRKFDSRAPVIFYSGAGYPADRENALAAGAQAYIVKPASIEMLIDTLRSTLHATASLP